MKLEEDPSKQLSPFYHGLLWGIIVTLTITVSMSIGASATFLFPSLSETIQTIYKSCQQKSLCK